MKKLYSLLFAVFLLLVSCAKDPEISASGTPLPGDHKVSVAAALAELHAVLGEIDGVGTRAGRSRFVGSVSTVKASDVCAATRSGDLSDVEELVYIANFEGGEGYAILGADDRLGTVIAITEEGSLTPKDFAAVARGEYAESDTPPMIPDVVGYVLDGVSPRITDDPWTTIKYGEWEQAFSIYRYPILPMKWGQREPYNYCVQQVHGDCPVGCSAVALGQIVAVRYNLTGHSVNSIGGRIIDWNTLDRAIEENRQGKDIYYDSDRDPIVINNQSMVIANFLYGVGLAINMKYAPDGSSANRDDARSFLSNLGFQNVTLSAYNESKVYSTIVDLGLPVWARGTNSKNTGHAWVIDGVYKQKRTVGKYNFYNVLLESWADFRTLYHCNFGYTGYCDGFYLAGIFDLSQRPIYQISSIADREDIYRSYPNYYKDLYVITYTGW